MSIETFDWQGYMSDIGYAPEEIPNEINDEDRKWLYGLWARDLMEQLNYEAKQNPFLATSKEKANEARRQFLEYAPDLAHLFGEEVQPNNPNATFDPEEFRKHVVNNEVQNANLGYYLDTFAASRINDDTDVKWPWLKGLTKDQFKKSFMEQQDIDEAWTSVDDIRNGNFGTLAANYQAQLAQQQGLRGDEKSGHMAALKQGWYEFEKLFGYTAGTLGDATGIQWLSDIGNEIAQNVIQKSDAYNYQSKYNQSLADTIKNEGVMAAGGKILNMAEENWATTAAPLALAAIGKILSTYAHVPQPLADAATRAVAANVVRRQGANLLRRASQLAYGSSAALSGLEIGGVRAELEEKGKYDPDNVADVVAAGLVSSSLDFIGNVAAMKGLTITAGRLWRSNLATMEARARLAKEIAEDQAKSFTRRVLSAMAVEGVTEGLQEIPAMVVGARRGIEYTPKEVRDRIIDAAAVGAFMGGGIRTGEIMLEKYHRGDTEDTPTPTDTDIDEASETPDVPETPQGTPESQPEGIDGEVSSITDYRETRDGYAAFDGFDVGYGATRKEAAENLIQEANKGRVNIDENDIRSVTFGTENWSVVRYGDRNQNVLRVKGQDHDQYIRDIIRLHNDDKNTVNLRGSNTFDTANLSRDTLRETLAATKVKVTPEMNIAAVRENTIDIPVNFSARPRENGPGNYAAFNLDDVTRDDLKSKGFRVLRNPRSENNGRDQRMVLYRNGVIYNVSLSNGETDQSVTARVTAKTLYQAYDDSRKGNKKKDKRKSNLRFDGEIATQNLRIRRENLDGSFVIVPGKTFNFDSVTVTPVIRPEALEIQRKTDTEGNRIFSLDPRQVLKKRIESLGGKVDIVDERGITYTTPSEGVTRLDLSADGRVLVSRDGKYIGDYVFDGTDIGEGVERAIFQQTQIEASELYRIVDIPESTRFEGNVLFVYLGDGNTPKGLREYYAIKGDGSVAYLGKGDDTFVERLLALPYIQNLDGARRVFADQFIEFYALPKFYEETGQFIGFETDDNLLPVLNLEDEGLRHFSNVEVDELISAGYNRDFVKVYAIIAPNGEIVRATTQEGIDTFIEDIKDYANILDRSEWERPTDSVIFPGELGRYRADDLYTVMYDDNLFDNLSTDNDFEEDTKKIQDATGRIIFDMKRTIYALERIGTLDRARIDSIKTLIDNIGTELFTFPELDQLTAPIYDAKTSYPSERLNVIARRRFYRMRTAQAMLLIDMYRNKLQGFVNNEELAKITDRISDYNITLTTDEVRRNTIQAESLAVRLEEAYVDFMRSSQPTQTTDVFWEAIYPSSTGYNYGSFVNRIHSEGTDFRFSRAAETPRVRRRDSILNELQKELGDFTLNEMLEKGLRGESGGLVILPDQEAAHNIERRFTTDATQPYYDDEGLIQGFVAPDGMIYLVEDGIVDGKARQIILHEYGVHARKFGMTDAQFQEVVQNIKAKRDEKSLEGDFIRHAITRAKQANKNMLEDNPIFWEEVAAYAVEDGYHLADTGIVGRMQTWMKNWLWRFGVIDASAFHYQDFVNMAQGMLGNPGPLSFFDGTHDYTKYQDSWKNLPKFSRTILAEDDERIERDIAYMEAVERGDMETVRKMANEWRVKRNREQIVYPALSDKDISDIARYSDDMGYELTPEMKKETMWEIIARLKKKGVTHVDFYHLTDYDSPIAGDIKGSSLDAFGGSSGNLRPSSVYAFMDPDDFAHGWNYVTGTEDKKNSVIHFRLPVDDLYKVHWDSNFNMSSGAYSGVRIDGDIAKEAIVGVYKYNSPFLDAVTYDDDGNVIPLSQRFNVAKNDIRYSRSISDGREEFAQRTYRRLRGLDEAIYRERNGEDADTIEQATDWRRNDQGDWNFRYSVAGEIGAARLDAAEEVTTRMDNLVVARDMEQAGKDTKAIKFATGWYRGKDGKWRYEISNNLDELTDKFEEIALRIVSYDVHRYFNKEGIAPYYIEKLVEKEGKGDFLRNIADSYEPLNPGVIFNKANYKMSEIFSSPDLFAAYPELADMTVYITGILFGYNTVAFYSTNDKTITLNDSFVTRYILNKLGLESVSAENMRNSLLHEIQHYIQDVEGFSRGASARYLQKKLEDSESYNTIKVYQDEMDKIKEELRDRDKTYLNKYRYYMSRIYYLLFLDFINNSDNYHFNDDGVLVRNSDNKSVTIGDSETFYTFGIDRDEIITRDNLKSIIDKVSENQFHSLMYLGNLSEIFDNPGRATISFTNFDEFVKDNFNGYLGEEENNFISELKEKEERVTSLQNKINEEYTKFFGKEGITSPDAAYRASMGESEARMVEKRSTLTSEELRDRYIEEDLDVPLENQINTDVFYDEVISDSLVRYSRATAEELKPYKSFINDLEDNLVRERISGVPREGDTVLYQRGDVNEFITRDSLYTVEDAADYYPDLEQRWIDYHRDDSESNFIRYSRSIPESGNFRSVPTGEQNQADVIYPDASAEIQAIRYSRQSAEDILKNNRSDFSPDQMKVILDELDSYGDDEKKQKLVLHWVVRGQLDLPEDKYKIDNAIKYAGNLKIDPYSLSPQKIINRYQKSKPEGTPIRPGQLRDFKDKEGNPLFTNPKNHGLGIVSYEVQDSKEGQEAMRKIMNTHWGKNQSPWCLLRADNQGVLQQPRAWKHWSEDYTGLPKRVAFKRGNLISFMATNDNEGEERSVEGILDLIKITIENDGFDINPYNYRENDIVSKYIERKEVGATIGTIDAILEGKLDFTYTGIYDSGIEALSEFLPEDVKEDIEKYGIRISLDENKQEWRLAVSNAVDSLVEKYEKVENDYWNFIKNELFTISYEGDVASIVDINGESPNFHIWGQAVPTKFYRQSDGRYLASPQQEEWWDRNNESHPDLDWARDTSVHGLRYSRAATIDDVPQTPRQRGTAIPNAPGMYKMPDGSLHIEPSELPVGFESETILYAAIAVSDPAKEEPKIAELRGLITVDEDLMRETDRMMRERNDTNEDHRLGYAVSLILEAYDPTSDIYRQTVDAFHEAVSKATGGAYQNLVLDTGQIEAAAHAAAGIPYEALLTAPQETVPTPRPDTADVQRQQLEEAFANSDAQREYMQVGEDGRAFIATDDSDVDVVFESKVTNPFDTGEIADKVLVDTTEHNESEDFYNHLADSPTDRTQEPLDTGRFTAQADTMRNEVEAFLASVLPEHIWNRMQILWEDNADNRKLLDNALGKFTPKAWQNKNILIRGWGRSFGQVVRTAGREASRFGWGLWQNRDFRKALTDFYDMFTSPIYNELTPYYNQMGVTDPTKLTNGQKIFMVQTFFSKLNQSLFTDDATNMADILGIDAQEYKRVLANVRRGISAQENDLSPFMQGVAGDPELAKQFASEMLRMTMETATNVGTHFVYERANTLGGKDRIRVYTNEWGTWRRTIADTRFGKVAEHIKENLEWWHLRYKGNPRAEKFARWMMRNLPMGWKYPMSWFHLYVPDARLGDTTLGRASQMISRVWQRIGDMSGTTIQQDYALMEDIHGILRDYGYDPLVANDMFDQTGRRITYEQFFRSLGITSAKAMEKARLADEVVRTAEGLRKEQAANIRSMIVETGVSLYNRMVNAGVPQRNIETMVNDFERKRQKFHDNYAHRMYEAFTPEGKSELARMLHYLKRDPVTGEESIAKRARRAQEQIRQAEARYGRGTSQFYKETTEARADLRRYERLAHLWNFEMAVLRDKKRLFGAELNEAVVTAMKNTINTIILDAQSIGRIDAQAVPHYNSISAQKARKLDPSKAHHRELMAFLSEIKDPMRVAVYSADQQRQIIAKLQFNKELGEYLVDNGMATIRGVPSAEGIARDLAQMESGTFLEYINVDPAFMPEIKAEYENMQKVTETVLGGLTDAVKANSTVYSLRLAMNNYIGNASMLLASGHFWRFGNWMEAGGIVRKQFLDRFTYGAKDPSDFGKMIIKEMEAAMVTGGSGTEMSVFQLNKGAHENFVQMMTGLLYSGNLLSRAGKFKADNFVKRALEYARKFYTYGDEWVKPLMYINNRMNAIAKYEAIEKRRNGETEEEYQERVLKKAIEEASEMTIRETVSWENSPFFVRQLSTKSTRFFVPDFLLHNFQMLRITASNYVRLMELGRELANFNPTEMNPDKVDAYRSALKKEFAQRSVGGAMTAGVYAGLAGATGSCMAFIPYMMNTVFAAIDGEDDKDKDNTFFNPQEWEGAQRILNYKTGGDNFFVPAWKHNGKIYAWNYGRASVMLTHAIPQPATENPEFTDYAAQFFKNIVNIGGGTIAQEIVNNAQGKDKWGREIGMEAGWGRIFDRVIVPGAVRQLLDMSVGYPGSSDNPYREGKAIKMSDAVGITVNAYDMRDIVNEVGWNMGRVGSNSQNVARKSFVKRLTESDALSDSQITSLVNDMRESNARDFDKANYVLTGLRQMGMENKEIAHWLTVSRKDANTILSKKQATAFLKGQNIYDDALVTYLKNRRNNLAKGQDDVRMSKEELATVLQNYDKAIRIYSQALRAQ